MYDFSSEPPPDPRSNALTLKRTPTGRPLKGIITSGNMVGTATHFYHGRTKPCKTENCEPCLEGMPWRWHGYVSLFNPGSRQHILFEMTAKTVQPLLLYRLAHGTLRGCMLTAKRVNLAPNARVVITTTAADLQQYSLPNEPHLLEALSILWNIELSAIRLDGLNKGIPNVRISPKEILDAYNPETDAATAAAGNGQK